MLFHIILAKDEIIHSYMTHTDKSHAMFLMKINEVKTCSKRIFELHHNVASLLSILSKRTETWSHCCSKYGYHNNSSTDISSTAVYR